ncbi:LppM family (lipo)protein [Sanguibacter suaedae]|uniref:LppM domain-containing protein n=1 Tax=Sanguibacter suaedae TaxID=2795737 RepID=A0A934IDN6_9MICO|nr:hypothetical protein [Sanguibacter suaedae]MBI9115845.1 hypothetical protein [Sanguibacter suaedae]
MRRLASTLGILLALALGGCSRVDATFVVSEDGTVDGSVVVAVSAEHAVAAGFAPGEPWADVEALSADLPSGVSAVPHDDGTHVGVEYVLEAVPLEGDDTDDSPLRFTREGDEHVVTGTIDTSRYALDDSTRTATPATGTVRIAITFPGDVRESTGTADGRTVVWEGATGDVLDVSARAAASPSAGGRSAPWAVGALGVLAAVAVLAILRARTSHRKDHP